MAPDFKLAVSFGNVLYTRGILLSGISTTDFHKEIFTRLVICNEKELPNRFIFAYFRMLYFHNRHQHFRDNGR